ncbi:MAG TPA: host specificity factor TipJ family phage tail protein [Phycisphaerales bacterium]|nr:host specificity factor TipJ family phage tail protein [Phycisphaerales bacterium]
MSTVQDLPAIHRPLPADPPAWVNQYIGIEYRHNGRGRDALDCWGLVRLLYRDQFGIALPSLTGLQDLNRERADSVQSMLFTPVVPPYQLGDIVEISGTRPGALHVGVLVARGLMLHAWERTSSCIEEVDSRLWVPRIRGVHRYAAECQVIARTNPLRAARVEASLPAGVCILDLLKAIDVRPGPGVVVCVDGNAIPRDAWAHVRPKAGRLVTVGVRPLGGGGKSAGRLLATVALIAASAGVGGWAAGALSAAGYGSAGVAIGGALASGAVMAGGYFFLNAMFPPPRQKLGDGGVIKSSPFLEGARNEIRQHAPFPAVLGDVRFAPPMGAVPYTESVGGDDYLRCLFVMLGPVDLSEFRIGDTPLEDFEGVEVEVRNGFPNELPCSLYPSTIVQDSMSLLLEQADGWQERTSAVNADELAVDLLFPRGLVEFAADGGRLSRTVAIELQYRKVGDSTWRDINPGSASPANFRELDFLFRTPEATFGGSGVHNNDLNWSGNQVAYPDAKPAYLPASWYAWEVLGAIYAPTSGTYHFAIDGSDACDLHINWQEIATFYGSHGPEVTFGTINSSTHTGSIYLTKGYHTFRARVESRSGAAGGGALAVAWKKPGDATFTIVPQANLARVISTLGYGSEHSYESGKLDYRWFVSAGYGSTITTTEASPDPVRKSVSWAVERGQYEIRIRRTTADSTSDQVFDEVYLSALKTIRAEDPIRQANVAKIALRIKASDQLNGQLDTFNVRARTIAADYDAASESWIQRVTSNCASLMRWVVQGTGIAEPWTDDQLDLAELVRLHGDGYTFNSVADQEGTVWERLQDIAACARSTPGLKDNKLTVVRDRVRTTPVQLFTPRNSWGFKGRKSFPDLPHALRMRFVSEDLEYKQDERIVFADGYTAESATRYQLIDVTGIVNGGAIWKYGCYLLAQMFLRPEVYTLNTDPEHMVCNRGDLVRLAHDVIVVGYSQGRVTGLIKDSAGNLKGVVVDEPCPMASGDTHAIRFRLKDNGQVVYTVVTEEGEQIELRFTSPIPVSSDQPEVGDLFAFGLHGLESRECLVKSIRFDVDLNATLELVDHAPAVHTADQGEIPPYDSGVTQPPDYLNAPEAPVIQTIRSDDTVLVKGPDGTVLPRILITLRPQSGLRPYASFIQVRWRAIPPGGDPQGPFRAMTLELANNQIAISDVEQGVEYQVRLRYVTAAGVASTWTSTTHTVLGKTGAPPNVQSFDVRRLSDGTRQFVWDLGVEPADVAGVLIRYGDPGDPWEDLTPLTNGPIEGASPWDSALPPTGGLKRFGIKMIDTSGLESPAALFVEKDLGVPPQENVVVSEDAHAAQWPGTRTDCFYTTGGVLEANDTTTWATLPATWTGWSRWNMNPVSPIRYTHTTIDIGVVFSVEPVAYVLADGSAVVEVAWSEVSSSPTNWTEITSLANQTIRARYIRFRVTVTATGGQPVPVIRELLMQLRAPIIHVELNDLDTANLDADHRLGVGDIRLPIPVGLFTQVRRVSLSFNGVGVGWTWEVVDKDPVLGPRVRLYDTNGNPAHAVIDVVVRGL